jgi:hypothetical protein
MREEWVALLTRNSGAVRRSLAFPTADGQEAIAFVASTCKLQKVFAERNAHVPQRKAVQVWPLERIVKCQNARWPAF